jgi:hypothetical protein
MNISRFFRSFIVLIALFLAACGQQTPSIYEVVSEGTLKSGEGIPAPAGEVVLTVDGNISQTNVGDTLQLDVATLESIGVIQYDVNDPFVKEKITYSGVLLSELLKAAGADAGATTLTLRALDDYSTDMNIADATKWPILLATRANGSYMPIDKNGPIISVFPFDDFPELDHLTYDALWVWSLHEITVK